MSFHYWIFFLLILRASFLAGEKTRSRQNIYLYFILILTFLFFAFRIGFTPDYYTYEQWFDAVIWKDFSVQNFSISQEPLFSLMASFVPYRFGLIIQTLLCCICIYIVLHKYIPGKFWPAAIALMFLYNLFMLGNISAFRSSFVTVAFFIALTIREKSFKCFLVGALLIAASGFIHQSGFIMLAPYLVCTRRPYSNTMYNVFLVISIIAIFILYTKIRDLNTMAMNIVEANFEKFETYMDTETQQGRINLTSSVYLLLFFYTSYFLKEKLTPFYHICVFQTCIFVLLNIMPQIGMISRFQFYFMFPATIGAISVYRYSKNQVIKIVYAVAWVYLLFRSLYLFLPAEYVSRTYAFYDNILFL